MFVRVCAKLRHFAAPRRLLATLSEEAVAPFATLRPPPPPNPNPNPNSTPATLDSLSAIPTATVSAEAHKPPLSQDQEKLLAAMTRGESVYFTGKAGAGKTEVLRRFIELCKGDITRKYRTQVTAPTGIAAAHITGGTLHSRFGLKVGVDPKRNDPKEIFNRCQHNTNLMARYILSKTVIIDEISMVHKREFDSISKAMSLLKSDLNSCSKVYDHMFAKLTTKGLSTEEVHQALGASDAGGLWDPNAISIPFGGAQVVLSGDFYQLPPIEKMSDEVIMYRQTITELYGSCPSESLEWHLSPYVFTSLEWKKLQEMCGMKTHILGKSFRQTNQEFVAFLDRLRIGEWDKSMHGFLHSRLDNFGKEKKIRPIKLCSYRREAEAYNSLKLSQISSKEYHFPSQDNVIEETPKDLNPQQQQQKQERPDLREWDLDSDYNELPSPPQKIIENPIYEMQQMMHEHALDFAHLPVSDLVSLRVGAQVVLLKNLNVGKGLVNGCRGRIVGFVRRLDELTNQELYLPAVEFVLNRGTSIGETELYVIGYEKFESEVTMTRKIERRQIPLKLGWGLTVHRSQGMSLDYVIVDMPKSFAPGQAYVALSRAKSMEGLAITRNLQRSSVIVSDIVKRFYGDLLSV